MAQWIVAAVLLVVWVVSWGLFHKSGFVHILLLCAIAIMVVQFVADRKAASS
jgi:F0F1-type ATP synthase assembly protein I